MIVSYSDSFLFCFKYWSFSNKVFLKIKSLKKKKKKKLKKKFPIYFTEGIDPNLRFWFYNERFGKSTFSTLTLRHKIIYLYHEWKRLFGEKKRWQCFFFIIIKVWERNKGMNFIPLRINYNYCAITIYMKNFRIFLIYKNISFNFW